MGSQEAGGRRGRQLKYYIFPDRLLLLLSEAVEQCRVGRFVEQVEISGEERSAACNR